MSFSIGDIRDGVYISKYRFTDDDKDTYLRTDSEARCLHYVLSVTFSLVN